MNFFELPLADNTLGSDPTVHLYKAINAAFPAFGLTRTNSKIVKIISAPTEDHPTLTYLLIQKGDDEQDLYELFYPRFDINDLMTNPIFTKTEAEQAAKLPSSAKLVDAISAKVKQNFRANDFWTSINSLDFSGGSVKPNWYMEAVYDSVYWCGSMYVWLHT